MNRLDRDKFKDIEDKVERAMVIMEELRQFAPDNPPYLSDIFVNVNDGGQAALIALEQHDQQQRMRPGGRPFEWKILVRRDEWGNAPAPGEKVARRVPINRKFLDNNDARYTHSTQINQAKVDGSYPDRFEESREYEVDEKGCITCHFDDAGYFLFNWGIHHKTNRGMCSKPEYSTDLKVRVFITNLTVSRSIFSTLSIIFIYER